MLDEGGSLLLAAIFVKLFILKIYLLVGDQSNGMLLALPVNIRLGWKRLAVTNKALLTG